MDQLPYKCFRIIPQIINLYSVFITFLTSEGTQANLYVIFLKMGIKENDGGGKLKYDIFDIL
jgi:hypothetical protein